MFHLTNKAWTPYRYYSCHSPGDGWGLVLHACWKQGQGLVMGVDSKNILKCVKHLVASIKIIWLVLLLDWDLDLWFSAEIHSWPRTSTGLGVTWAAADPMTVANSNGYSSHLKHLKPTAKPTLLFSPMPQAEPQASGIWGMVLSCPSTPLTPSLCHGKGKGWREQLCFYSCELSTLVTTTFLSLLSGHTDCISRGSGQVPALPRDSSCVCCLWENRAFSLWPVRKEAVSSGVKLPSCRPPPKMSFEDSATQTEPVHSICLYQECEDGQY